MLLGIICFVHTFGPIFFVLNKINIIEIREAGMYTMLFGTFFIKILTIFGCYNLSKSFIWRKKLASIFSLLVVTLPFEINLFTNMHPKHLEYASMLVNLFSNKF